MRNTQALMQQSEALPPERIAEGEDFVAFIAAHEHVCALARAASAASAPSFAAVWNNPEDDAYDAI